jgi:hypothetical protein
VQPASALRLARGFQYRIIGGNRCAETNAISQGCNVPAFFLAVFIRSRGASLHCCPCLGLGEGDGFERTVPHGSTGVFLSGILPIADLYASSTAFCFSFSSGVIWRSCGAKLIPGVLIWAEAAPVSKAIIVPAWTIFRSMSLVKLTMTESMPHSVSFRQNCGHESS